MLQLERYGIVLRQIGPDDLEKLRLWRNSPEVAQYMAYREEISPEMQQSWFQRVCERGDLYFIICEGGRELGLINLKDIDRQAGEAEGGIYLAEEAFCNSLTPFRASLCLSDFAFEILRLKRLKAYILDANKRAIRYNTMLGYKPTSSTVNQSNRLYFLDPDDYYSQTLPRLKRVVGS
jgi:RimJ/RimL family protein N-acetyltransferase